MNTTFYSQHLTKTQYEKLLSNWKNIREVEENQELLDTTNRMKMDLRVPIRLKGSIVYMTVKSSIIAREDPDSIQLSVVGNVLKPIFVSILSASPIVLVTALLLNYTLLIILLYPLIALIIYYVYLQKIKSTSKVFVNALLKEI